MKPIDSVRLPPDYRMQWVEGEFRLFAADGKLLFTLPAKPNTLVDLEKYAWQHAWRQIEKEVRREVQLLRDGTLTIKELRRMRQYLRLMEALAEEMPQEAREPTLGARIVAAVRSVSLATRIGSAVRSIPLPSIRLPRPRAAVLALAGGFAAGLLAFVLLTGMLTTPSVPQAQAPGPHIVATPRIAATSRVAPPALTQPSVAVPSVAAPAVRRTERQAGRLPARVAGYATVFGNFTSAEAATVRARLVRAKGYVARVVPAGTSFRVLGRTYARRSDAERMARIFREIGLPASVQPLGL